MADYRNRPPVDAPRPTWRDLLRDAGTWEIVGIAASYVGIGLIGYFLAAIFLPA